MPSARSGAPHCAQNLALSGLTKLHPVHVATAAHSTPRRQTGSRVRKGESRRRGARLCDDRDDVCERGLIDVGEPLIDACGRSQRPQVAEAHFQPRTIIDAATRVADYIAGMTDRYALRIYEQLFLPQRWLL